MLRPGKERDARVKQIAHITVGGVPLCEYHPKNTHDIRVRRGSIYYSYDDTGAVRFCGLIKCEYDSHWNANDAATYMIQRMSITDVESCDGCCPSKSHAPPWPPPRVYSKYHPPQITLSETHQYTKSDPARICCWKCRKGFATKQAAWSHFQVHTRALEENRDRLGDKITPVKMYLTEEDLLGQCRLELPIDDEGKKYPRHYGDAYSFSLQFSGMRDAGGSHLSKVSPAISRVCKTAAAIKSRRPHKMPLFCGPLMALPPLKATKSAPISINLYRFSIGGS